jgi:polyisoprenoid-binding protein YceI
VAAALRHIADPSPLGPADHLGMSTKYAQAVGPGLWHADRSRSAVGFRVRHFGVAAVRGQFESFACRVLAGDGDLRVEGQVDVASVQTGNAIRDRRLRSEFFDTQSHPAISLLAHADASGRRMLGELTIRGVSRPVELELTVDADQDEVLRLRATGTIRRSDFGLEWEALREAGRLLVADEVRLLADVVLRRS